MSALTLQRKAPPHKGEGLTQPLSLKSDLGKFVPRVFSPLVGEMAGRPEGDFIHDAVVPDKIP